MIHLVIVDANGTVVHNLTRLIRAEVGHPLLPEVVVTRIVFDGNPYPIPRVYIHSDGGYDGDEIERLARLCASFNLSMINDGQIHYPGFGRDPVVVFYGGAADGIEAAVNEGHVIDELAKACQTKVVLCRPPAGTWTVNGPIQIAEYRPPIYRADGMPQSPLDAEIKRLLREWGYHVESYHRVNGENGMTRLDKFEH